jgi:hypothetical protein
MRDMKKTYRILHDGRSFGRSGCRYNANIEVYHYKMSWNCEIGPMVGYFNTVRNAEYPNSVYLLDQLNSHRLLKMLQYVLSY